MAASLEEDLQAEHLDEEGSFERVPGYDEYEETLHGDQFYDRVFEGKDIDPEPDMEESLDEYPEEDFE